MERRKSSVGWLLILLITVLVLTGAWLYTNWRSSQTVLPVGLTINGLSMTGMTREQALATIIQAYTVPVTVTYAGEVISPLLPEMVELTVDEERTATNLDAALSERSGIQAFLTYVARTFLAREPEPKPVNAVVNYSRERVDAFLERIAQKYDHPPQASVLLPEAGTFRPAQRGTELDAAASLPLLISGLLAADPAQRQVDLVVHTEPAPATPTDVLQQALAAALLDFEGVAGIFAKDLSSGKELCINCDVAFSGLSITKLPIALELARVTADPFDAETIGLLSTMVSESDGAAANALLARIGASDATNGAALVTDFLWNLGLQSTFLAAPYGLEGEMPPPAIVTPANSSDGPSTAPDAYRQTTAGEMGLLLEGIYQCAGNGGFLRLLYPQEITPAECEEILALLESNQANPVLQGGLPEGTRLAYKHGWVGTTHAAVAVVYGHSTDIVLTVFLYQPTWLVWEESVPTFSSISQLVYRFFDGGA